MKNIRYILLVFTLLTGIIIAGCDGTLDDLTGNTTVKKYKPGEYDKIVKVYAKKNKVPENLVRAVIEIESGWNISAVSPQGAIGLMQLMPGTADMLGVKDPFDAEQNISGGTKYLRMLINRFNGDYKLALAGYNAGPAAVEKYNGIPDYEETINYVNNVMSIYESYEKN